MPIYERGVKGERKREREREKEKETRGRVEWLTTSDTLNEMVGKGAPLWLRMGITGGERRRSASTKETIVLIVIIIKKHYICDLSQVSANSGKKKIM